MNSIYLLQNFNNYYNRKVKLYQEVKEYQDKAVGFDAFGNINFNPNDGSRTSLVIGGPSQRLSGIPDYLLVLDDENKISSRWFVIEATRTRNGQYDLRLKRDVIADHYGAILQAPIYVEKAVAQPGNPLIFNSEGYTFNQIKKKEILLKDETKTNWIVGYIARDTVHDGDIVSTMVSSTDTPSIDSLAIDLLNPEDPAAGATYKVLNGNVVFTGWMASIINGNYIGSASYENKAMFGGDGIKEYKGYSEGAYHPVSYTYFGAVDTNYHPGAEGVRSFTTKHWGETFKNHYKATVLKPLMNYLDSKGHTPITYEDKAEVQRLNGKRVYSAKTGKYYKLTIGGTTNNSYHVDILQDSTPALFAAYNTMKKYFFQDIPSEYKDESFSKNPYDMDYSITTVNISLQEVAGPGTIKTKISANRQHLIDAPFDMFAIPFDLDNLNLATSINLALGQSVYDIQIVPYCPVRKLVDPDGVNLAAGVVDVDYSRITNGEGTKNISYILWATTSSDTLYIRKPITVPTDAVELKVAAETDIYRLTSPNYNGVFEFNAAKNGGVEYFIVDYTYKPYSPYIHVAPNFSGLYGEDFGDSRGLICNGDFSIAMTSDAWRSYEINNKNYQNIFNTEINTMDTLNNFNIAHNIFEGLAGGAAAGLGTGLLTGSAKGGLIAGGISGTMGMIDTVIQDQMYQTQRAGKVAIHDLQLGNIKARPDTLTKVSAYNINNKYFPFIEYYTATDVEKEALRRHIQYEGMRIGAMGTLSEYVDKSHFSFFKGQLVRLENVADDSHIIEEINNELNGGLYF